MAERVINIAFNSTVDFGYEKHPSTKQQPPTLLTFPFLHLVIETALDDDVYEALAAEFPSSDMLLDDRELASNKNYHYPALYFFLHERRQRKQRPASNELRPTC